MEGKTELNQQDEEWAHRKMKRTQAVAIIKKQCKPANERDGQAPVPDPADRNLSKRGWEQACMEWRRWLRSTGAAAAQREFGGSAPS